MHADDREPLLRDLEAQQGFLVRAARQLVGDERAEDLAQDAWIAALERPPARAEALRGWLARVLRNRRASLLERDARRTAREAAVAREEALPGPDEVQARLELVRRVAAAMQALPEPYAQVLYARVYADQQPRAIAKELGVPVETVYSRLRRGKALLRERLDAEYGDRAAWSVLLVPWVGSPLPAPPPASAAPLTAASTTTWSLVMAIKPLAATAVVLVAGLAYWWARGGTPETGTPAAVGAPTVVDAEPARGAEAATLPSAEHADRAARAVVERPAAAVPAGRAALALRVAFADGSPVSDAYGQVAPGREYDIDPERVRPFQLDVDGRVALADLEPGDQRITLFGRGGWDVVLPPDERTERDFTLPVGVTVRGRVLTPDGDPAAGALVHLVPDRSVALEGLPLALTDEAGRFHLRDLAPWRPSGPWTELTAGKDGYLSAEAFTVGGELGSARELTLRLYGPAGRLAGRVVDEAGTPVAGARLELPAHDNRSSGFTNEEGVTLAAGPRLELETAADGTFATARARLGEQPVRILHDDHPESTRLVSATAGAAAPIELVLSNGGTLTGTLRDSDGAPVADHLVRMDPEHEHRYRYARTDASGAFTARGLPPGPVSLWVSQGSGTLPDHEAVIEHGVTTTVRLTLAAERPAAGTLTAEDGTPLARHRVCISTPDAPGVWIRDARTDEAGHFTFDDVPAGDKVLEVRTPLAFEHPPLLVLPWPGDDALDLVVPDANQPSARVTFRVVDEDDSAVAGAEWWLSHTMRNWSKQGFTDEAGRGEHAPLVPGRYSLRVEAPALVEYELAELEVERDGTTDLGDLRLVRGGRLEVTLRSSDPAVDVVHAHARLVPEGGGPTVHVQSADGSLVSPLLTPGAYVLRVASHTVAAMDRPVRIEAGETTAFELTVEPGTYRHFRFVPPFPEDARPTVDVLAPDGSGYGGEAWVLGDSATVGGLTLGAWRLVVRGLDGEESTFAFTVDSLDPPTSAYDVPRPGRGER